MRVEVRTGLSASIRSIYIGVPLVGTDVSGSM
jgi:hypothetical protein